MSEDMRVAWIDYIVSYLKETRKAELSVADSWNFAGAHFSG